MIGAALGAAVLAVAALASASGQPAGDAAAAAAAVTQQLEAFRRGDYDAAYAFASEAIREMFDRQAFERMVTRGYPEIARSTAAWVADSLPGSDGHLLLRLVIRGANGSDIEAVYDMVREGAGWRVNGVATRPGTDLL